MQQNMVFTQTRSKSASDADRATAALSAVQSDVGGDIRMSANGNPYLAFRGRQVRVMYFPRNRVYAIYNDRAGRSAARKITAAGRSSALDAIRSIINQH